MQSALLLHIVVCQSAIVLQLLAGKNKALLIRRDTFLVLNLGLDLLNRVGRLYIQRNRLARERLDEYLHFYLCRLLFL